MARWNITQTVEYIAEGIEADTKEEARDLYLKDQDMYYSAVESERIEEIEWCESCDSEEARCQCEEDEGE